VPHIAESRVESDESGYITLSLFAHVLGSPVTAATTAVCTERHVLPLVERCMFVASA
jgi:hypothetical protein